MTNTDPTLEHVLLRNVLERRDELSSEDEANLKEHVIGPVLRALEWDTGDPGQVRVEYPTDNQAGKPDYCLLCDGKPMAFVEAKRPGADLDRQTPTTLSGIQTMESPEEQLLRYLKPANESDPMVPIGVLTNGFEWRFYYTGTVEHEWRLLTLNLEKSEFIDEVTARDTAAEFQTYLGRKPICEGSAEATAQVRVAAQKRWHELVERVLPVLWKQFKSNVEDKFDEDLTPEEILGALQDLVRTEHDVPTEETENDDPEPNAGRQSVRRITSIDLSGDVRESRKTRDALLNLWNLLREKHSSEFDQIVEDPTKCLKSLIRRGVEGESPFKEEYTNEHLAATDYWVNLYAGTDLAINYMRRICKAFGYERHELRIQVDGEWLD